MRSTLTFAFITLCLTGCVFEKKTVILNIPEDSPKAEIFLLNEGCSVGKLMNVNTSIDFLKHYRETNTIASVFFLDEMIVSLKLKEKKPKESPLEAWEKKHFRFSGWTFYTDSERKRKLGCYQKVTIPDRNKLVKEINSIISEALGKENANLGSSKQQEKNRKNIEKLEKNLKEQWEIYRLKYPGFQLVAAFGKIVLELDEESGKLLTQAAENSHQWLRIKPGMVTVHFPVTKECALRIKNKATVLKKLFAKDDPLTLEAGSKGITFKFGSGKGSSIWFTMTNSTWVKTNLDPELIKGVDPEEKTTAKKLIRRFLKAESN